MYGVNSSSDSISRDMNSVLYSSTFKHPADGEFAKIKQLISLDPYQDYETHNTQNQALDVHEQGSHGTLLRNRSTPSSFFSNLLNENGVDDEFADEPAEEIFFVGSQQKKSESDARDFLHYASSSSPMKQERKETMCNNNNNNNNNTSYGGYMNQSDLDNGSSSFRGMDSTSSNSNLIRQSSTPAGFLSSLTNHDNGFAGMKDVRKGAVPPSTLNKHINFSLGPSSTSRFLPQIAENEDELNDSTFSSLKRNRDGGMKMSQNGETGNHTPNLVHHMSLPKTSSEMAAVENFLHFQQDSSVPWKTRAKRGFATHPRSIAERVRRTRISERIKRLQELFPDMDKQTNTADMLDMAVEYIKDLQKELQTLNDARARCTCSSKQLQSGSTM